MSHGYHKQSEGECKSCQDRMFRGHLKSRYGITLEEYEAMAQKQRNVCAICDQPEKDRYKRRLCVDHNHATGEIRGLLCHMCNTGLGKFIDNPVLLNSAAQYLIERGF